MVALFATSVTLHINVICCLASNLVLAWFIQVYIKYEMVMIDLFRFLMFVNCEHKINHIGGY